jgi:hypothetical protein
LLALGAESCGGYVAQPVTPVTLIAVAQRARVKVATQADVLLVVDDSLSMSGKQQRLADALASFATALDSLQPPIEYHAAVVSTSVMERFGACAPPGDPGAAQQCDSDWEAPGFTCDDHNACSRAFPDRAGKLHPPQAGAKPILVREDHTSAEFARLLGEAVQVGTDGSRQPQGFEAMRLAVSDSSSGFIRDGAKLVLAFFSDADDCSDPNRNMSMLTRDPTTGAITDNCALDADGKLASGHGLKPVSDYVNFLRELKNKDGSSKEVEVASIISLADGTGDPGLCTNPSCESQCDMPAAEQACTAQCQNAPDAAECASDCSRTCHLFCGGQVAGRRYSQMAVAFSGVMGNVCSDDASEPLARLSSVIGIPTKLYLYTEPESLDLLQVRIERGNQIIDCPLDTGFTLSQSPTGPVVNLLDDCKLQPEDIWDIRYLARK